MRKLIVASAVTFAVLVAFATVRPVNAEDECAESTYSVYRLPWLFATGGSVLVCIGE